MTETTASNTEPKRLDLWLKEHFPERSRTYFQKLIEEGLVLVNGGVAQKRQQITAGDEIEITFTEKAIHTLEPEEIPLEILYEDDHLIAINKASGIVVHPAPGSPNHTLVNALLFYLGGSPTKDPVRPGIVHRLDKETSGVIIVAKSEQAHEKLTELFAARAIEKTYLAITLGTAPPEQTIDQPIGRNERDRQKMAVRAEGKRAISHLKCLATNKDLSLVEVKIETGRTHQIRVHLRYIGIPILGDSTYGNKGANTKYKAERQMLHAWKLELNHPITQEKLIFKAPLPSDIKAIATHLKD